MNARMAVELKLADKILYTEDAPAVDEGVAMIFSQAAVTNSLLGRIRMAHPPDDPSPTVTAPSGTPIELLERRLNLLSH